MAKMVIGSVCSMTCYSSLAKIVRVRENKAVPLWRLMYVNVTPYSPQEVLFFKSIQKSSVCCSQESDPIEIKLSTYGIEKGLTSCLLSATEIWFRETRLVELC